MSFHKYTLNEVVVMIKDDHEAVSADIFVTPPSNDDVFVEYSEDDDQPTAPKRKKCLNKTGQSTWKWRHGDISENCAGAGAIADKPRFLLVLWQNVIHDWSPLLAHLNERWLMFKPRGSHLSTVESMIRY